MVTAINIHDSEKFKVTKFTTSLRGEFYAIYPKTLAGLYPIDIVVIKKDKFETKCMEAIKGAEFNFDDFLADIMND